MGLFAAVGVGAKIVKGLWKGARAKRKARKARARLKKAEALEKKSQGILASAGYMNQVLVGAPAIAPTISEVQEKVFGGTPNMNLDDRDPTTTFTSTGGGRVEQLKWYQKIPMWVWIVGGTVIGLPILIFLGKAIFKRR